MRAAGFRPSPPPAPSYPGPHVAPWSASLLGSPTSAGSTAVPAGASKPYLQRTSTPCSGLAPLVSEVCLSGVSALPSSASVPRYGPGGSTVVGLPIGSSSPLPLPCAPRLLGWWGSFHVLSAPVHAPSVCSLLRWSLQGFCPPGATQSLRGCCCPVATRLLRRLPGGNPVGFPPLWRPRVPRCRPALPRFLRHVFTACLLVSPFAPTSNHGGPALPPCWWPWRGVSRCPPAGPRFPM